MDIPSKEERMVKINIKYVPSNYVADFNWFGVKAKRVFKWIRF